VGYLCPLESLGGVREIWNTFGQCLSHFDLCLSSLMSRSHIEQRRQNHVFANYRRESHITGRPKTATRVLSASMRSESQDCRDSPCTPLQRSRRDVWKTRHGCHDRISNNDGKPTFSPTIAESRTSQDAQKARSFGLIAFRTPRLPRFTFCATAEIET